MILLDPTDKSAEEKQIGPDFYGTAAIAEEGHFARAGWGGRSR